VVAFGALLHTRVPFIDGLYLGMMIGDC